MSQEFARPRLTGRRFVQRSRANPRKTMEHATLNPLDIETRLEELAQLQEGWLNGKGRALDHAGLLRLAQAFDARYASDLPLPHLYPTAEGGVQAEWTLGDWEVSLEIALPNLAAEYQALHVKTGESRACDLALANRTAWTTLNDRIKALQEGHA